jgi:hypothetical protein
MTTARPRTLRRAAAPVAALLAAVLLLGGLVACENLPEPREDWHMWHDRYPMPRGA